MEEQISLLGDYGLPESKKTKKEIQKPVKVAVSHKKKKRTIDEMLADCIQNLENDQCTVCGEFLESIIEQGQEYLYCPADGCKFRILASEVKIVLKKGRKALLKD